MIVLLGTGCPRVQGAAQGPCLVGPCPGRSPDLGLGDSALCFDPITGFLGSRPGVLPRVLGRQSMSPCHLLIHSCSPPCPPILTPTSTLCPLLSFHNLEDPTPDTESPGGAEVLS